MNVFRDAYVSLSRGGRFYFDDVTVSTFSIEEIADALSKICRFTGHTQRFYSVAEHSVLTSLIVPKAYAFEALMHDAHEAFVGDVAAPLKSLLVDYQVVEDRAAARVRKHFGLPAKTSQPVKWADLEMLALEKRDLLPSAKEDWLCLEGIEPAQTTLLFCEPSNARQIFLERFQKLTAEAA